MASESTSSFGSHNPFRRKINNPIDVGGASSPSTSPMNDPDTRSRSARTPTTPSDFARALSSLPNSNNNNYNDNADAAAIPPPPVVTFHKQKPVKKVRVQSPPPSSPESTSAEHTYPKYPLPPRDDGDDDGASNSSDGDDDELVNGEREDPFANEAPPLPAEALLSAVPERTAPTAQTQTKSGQAQRWTGRGPPPNPFQKTLEDLEQSGGGVGGAREEAPADEQQQTAGTGRTGMDVEAFKRLLLTGQGPASGDGGGSTTETSSLSRQSISSAAARPPLDTPRTSHEISEPERDGDERRGPSLPTPSVRRSGSRKKPPPPPPMTRHGKLIKEPIPSASEGRTAAAAAAAGSDGSLTDVNKPLPLPPPHRPEDGDAKNNIFEQEAAGKIPEVDIDPDADADAVPSPRPPTPPGASHSTSEPIQDPVSTLRRPGPPRQKSGPQRVRSGSKSSADLQDESPAVASPSPRSSLESQRSRSSSLRNLHVAAPVPPPPRRGHRQSPSVSTPASPWGHQQQPQASPSLSLASPLPMTGGPTSPGVEDTGVGLAKLSSPMPTPPPPPPPPQRNTSLRRNGGAGSSTAPRTPNRVGSGVAPPPPPPPRTRGGSKGSAEGPASGGGLTRTKAAESTRRGGGDVAAVTEEEAELDNSAAAKPAGRVDTGLSDEAVQAMLADLDALQREVDAARMAAGSE